MKPKIIIFEDTKEIAEYVVDILEKELKKKPASVFCVPTGKTVIPVYEEITKTYKEKKLDFSKVKIFDLDEYIGLKPEHKKSFRHFLDKNLYKKVNIKENNINFLNGAAINIDNECKQYEEKIKKAGGVDITLLGIGVNGHIAFNEPGSPFDSRTREIILTYQTRASNFGRLYSLMISPKKALTMGIGTILKSRKIILIAIGRHKAKAVKAMLESEPNTNCPASALQKHDDVTVLLDKKAASLLKKKN
ncbi:MAG: glucosamine-6-phosphate deaminase [Nanoarchaeota archaeon]|nr:glucosamine-6-phosphate deaminase [Nanoarchaeota archaeon]MBU0977635.1 glucosamine-6-phosphate deaminase [Nanoarchaeota archaeon]